MPADFQATADDLGAVEEVARRRGCSSVAEYLRQVLAFAEDQAQPPPVEEQARVGEVHTHFKTPLGRVLWGNSLDYLFGEATEGSVDLIMTSPPFGLVRKKSYGNKDADHYCDWFRPFARGFRRVLKANGSLVIDIGGSWEPGRPTRSLYHFELLLMLCQEFGFHLCQEHYWWNPSKLPTPAEWVNIRRVRVKDAVNCIWWLSLSPWPKANNRRVLAPYSKSMRSLMKNGYKAQLRPSGHEISEKFGKDNGGSVPPNLLAVANTESNGRYQDYCRRNKLPIHPARFPETVPEYFVRMLTDRDDLVLDPFAGSCVTGAVAERLNRKWICCEMDRQFLAGAMARFQPPKKAQFRKQPTTYAINSPCSINTNEDEIPLVSDGGYKRSATVGKSSHPKMNRTK